MSLVKFAQKEIGTSQEAVMEKAENNVLYKKAVAQATAEAFLEELVEYSAGGSMEKTAAITPRALASYAPGANALGKAKAAVQDFAKGMLGIEAKGAPVGRATAASTVKELLAKANGKTPLTAIENDFLKSLQNEINPYATLAGKGTTTVGALGLGAYGANKLIGNSSIMPIVEDGENDWNEMLRMGLGGAAVGAGANALYDYTTNDNTDAASLLHAALTGGAAGGAAGTLGGALSEYGDEYTKTTI